MSAPLVLASRSPRRAQLLRAAGYVFTTAAADLDEEAIHPEVASPSRRVELIAGAKARAVAALSPGAWVLGADTMVVLGAEALGKPRDAEHALWMLSRLSGTSHEVVTGLALVAPDGHETVGFAATRVAFARWPAGVLVAYARSPEVLDKAGAYGIQEVAGAFVERVEGCFYNVVGLPLERLTRLWREASPEAPGPFVAAE
ncbi:MAG: Maf family protein [Candidatus Eisenbacteria bacterium]